jgi:CheY-like chemotaxis protein
LAVLALWAATNLGTLAAERKNALILTSEDPFRPGFLPLVVLGQAVLIAVLVRSRRRGQRLTKDLKDRESQLLQNRAELKDLLRFERMSADISSTLMRVPAEDLGKQIGPAMGQVAQLLGFDAATLAIFSPNGTALLPHVWHASDTPGLPANLTDKDFPWSALELLAGRDVHIRALDDFPPEAQTDRATYERYGLKSALDVPMIVSGQPVGVLSMGSFRKELSVSPQLVERQRALGNVFGNALVRARSEIALRESERRLALATTAGDLGLWFWNLQSNALWATERAKTMFGLAPESELTYEMFYAQGHPAGWTKVQYPRLQSSSMVLSAAWPSRYGFDRLPTPLPNIKQPLIAIVDDDESVCRAIKRLVRSIGMAAETYVNSAEFVDLIEALPSFQPDCVVLDVQMPGMSGIDVQANIRRVRGAIPIIFITAHEDRLARTQALAAGAVAFLRKPFNDALFIRTLDAALGRDEFNESRGSSEDPDDGEPEAP